MGGGLSFLDQCIRDGNVIYAVKLAREDICKFEALAKRLNVTLCEVLSKLLKQWLDSDRKINLYESSKSARVLFSFLVKKELLEEYVKATENTKYYEGVIVQSLLIDWFNDQQNTARL